MTALVAATVALVLTLAVMAASSGSLLAAIVGGPSATAGGEVTLGAVSTSADGGKVVSLAKSVLGRPYIWGAAGPAAFDCSGLVFWVYQQLGVSVPRTADQQYAWATPISPPELAPGDLTFYESTYPAPYRITHVGIYAGGGVVLMATTSGDFVRAVALSDPYWRAHFAGAGRILPYPAPAEMRRQG